MAKTLKKFEFKAGIGTTSKHDWATILDGECRAYIQGTDFEGKPQTMRMMAYKQGRKRGLVVRVGTLGKEDLKAERLPEDVVAIAIQATPADAATLEKWAAEDAEKAASNGHSEDEGEEGGEE